MYVFVTAVLVAATVSDGVWSYTTTTNVNATTYITYVILLILYMLYYLMYVQQYTTYYVKDIQMVNIGACGDNNDVCM